MTAHDSPFVYIPRAERERIARRKKAPPTAAYDGLSVYIPLAERERIAQREGKKAPRRTTRKNRSTQKRRRPQASMKKAAKQITVSRRASKVVVGLSLASLGVLGLWAMPKFLHQHGSDNTAPEAVSTSVSTPQTYVSPATKTEEAAPTVKAAPVEAAVPTAINPTDAPMTKAERHAKPFVDRELHNRELMNLIYEVSATTGTAVPTLLEVVAAETGGKPGNPLQVTPPQFTQLLGAFGQTYADKMETYAASLTPGKAQQIRKQATELRFLSQFMEHKDGQFHFYAREDFYKSHMQKALGRKAKFASLDHRIEKLYQNDYIRTGMQALSDDADGAKLAKSIPKDDPRQIFATPRARNFLGLTSIMNVLKYNYSDNLSVVGHLMNARTAEANKVAYHVKIKEIVTKLHKHIVKKIKIPFTIGEFKKDQLEPWLGAEEGFQGQWERSQPKRTSVSQSATTLQAPKITG